MTELAFGESTLPDEQQKALRKAKRLAWISLAYVISAVGLVLLVMGNSQAMRAAWLEDMLSLLPPLAFLIAARLTRRSPDRQHPYGWHRSIGVAHLSASLALLAMGLFVVIESTLALVNAEHPTIGTLNVFGYTFWQGWAMIVVLAYTGIPNVFIGRAKQKLAGTLHDRVLHADGEMNKDDWATASGAMIGVLGAGLGIWWLDSAIAVIIGASVIRDGLKNVRGAVAGLTDVRARTTDNSAPHPLIGEILHELDRLNWVQDAGCRVRDLGHVFHVEAWVVPRGSVDASQTAQARDRIAALDWKLEDIVIVPVQKLPAQLSRS